MSAASALGAYRALAQSAARGTRLVMLGTQGGPNFNLERGETAHALVVGERLYLVDCGYGTLAALTRAGLSYRSVDQPFLTRGAECECAVRDDAPPRPEVLRQRLA